MDFMSEYRGLINYEKDCVSGGYSPNNIKHLVVLPSRVFVVYHLPYKKKDGWSSGVFADSSSFACISDVSGVSGVDLCRVLLEPVCGSLESIVLVGRVGLAGKFEAYLHTLGNGVKDGIAGRFKRLYGIVRLEMKNAKISGFEEQVWRLYRDARGSGPDILKLFCESYAGEYLYRNDGDWWSAWGRLYEKRPFDKALLKRFTDIKELYDEGKEKGVLAGQMGAVPEICLKKIDMVLGTLPPLDELLRGGRTDVVLDGLLRLRSDIVGGKFKRPTKSFPKVIVEYFTKMLKAYRREIGGDAFKSITSHVGKGVQQDKEPDIFVLWAAYLHGESYSNSVKMLGWG